MTKTITFLVFLMSASGCNNATAKSYDSSNPVNCMTVFGIVRAAPETTPEVRQLLEEKALALGLKHGGLNWVKKIEPDAIKFAKKLEADKDVEAVTRLVEDCMAT